MRTLNSTDPKQFIADFFSSFHDELVRSDEDPALVFDRYHTPDIVQVADGHRMDRDKLIAHTRPVRKNRPAGRMDVHEALVNGDRIAARYTLYVQMRKKNLAIEVCFFGQFTDEGRMRQAHMLTRSVPTDVDQAEQEASA
ncbi:nuclear transport factor 2 family protein [Amycolatopsis taiwanensis]|uniref:SnoaL-like domain-containing protein n=1 Tax=Amycolatopsis taiwanensis TaxID=342230 RepID=A0A9W6R2Y9_9PSEU|nr:nuclear transport factor 2 family protein [Amycolatopsis taiwanensis]GLY68174.1 hypothetical protein Atai01_47930 [Amycolatopsis taiwanensis]